MRPFLVTSPGYTATKWLAWALDQAPDVSCTHSASEGADEAEYDLPTLVRLAADKHGPRDEQPVARFVEGLRARGEREGARVIGNVHRYSLTALRKNEARFGIEADAAVVNLVRHPVPWLESGAAQLGRMVGVSPVIRKRVYRHARRLAAEYRALGCPREPWPVDLAFSYLCGRLRRLVVEAHDDVAHVRMEDLTTDRMTLARVFETLTAGAPDPAWLDRVLERGRLHRHRTHARDPREQLDAWEPWKRRVFEYWARKTGLVSIYARLGYVVELPGFETRRPRAKTIAAPLCAPKAIERGLQTGLRRTDAAPIRWTRLLEPRLRRVLDTLTERLRASGLPRLDPRQRWAPMSRGLEGGTTPQLPQREPHQGWRVAAAHPVMHDRSPALHCQHDAGVQHVLSYKGAGIRSPQDSFVVRAGRSPRFVQALRRGVRKPIDVLFDRPPGDWRSHELVGGARFVAAIFEARNALAWHALLLRHDSKPAATCIPLRMWRPQKLEGFVVGDTESLAEALHRLTTEQFTIAIDALSDPKADVGIATAASIASIGRIAAVLRLVRSSIGDESYRTESTILADTEVLLNALLDGRAPLRALDHIRARYAPVLRPEAFAELRTQLLRRHQLRRLQALSEGEALGRALHRLRRARARFAAWPLDNQTDVGMYGREPIEDSFDAVGSGLVHTYRRGRKRWLATKGGTRPPSEKWIRESAHLAAQLELLSSSWPAVLEAMADSCRELGSALADERALASLQHLVDGDPTLMLEDAELTLLTSLLATGRRELASVASTLGARIYMEQPEQFLARLSAYWDARDQA